MSTAPRSLHDLMQVLDEDAHDVQDAESVLARVATLDRPASRRRPRARVWLPILAVATVVGIAVGVLFAGTPAHRRPGGTGPTIRVSSTAPSAATNRQRTAAETVRLVHLVNLPPGAAAIGPQTSLPGPALGTPLSSDLIDTVRYWRVPLPYTEAVAWFTSHPPSGLHLMGRSGPTGAQKQFSGYMYPGADSSAWIEASLEVGVLADTAPTTVWRVDGMAIWTDPTPARDVISGPRMPVTVTSGCPPSDHGLTDIANTAPGLTQYLLPAAGPDRALVCEYAGNGEGSPATAKPDALIESRTPDATVATHLAELIRKVSLASIDDPGVTSCGAADGSVIVVAFAYPNGADIALWDTNSGCPTLDNGSIVVGLSSTGFYDAEQAIAAATK